MASEDSARGNTLPLSGFRVLEISRTVAAAYAGRLLAAMGASVVMLEPPGGSPLRNAPPLLDGTAHSALFAFLAGGKSRMLGDLSAMDGRSRREKGTSH